MDGGADEKFFDKAIGVCGGSGRPRDGDVHGEAVYPPDGRVGHAA